MLNLSLSYFKYKIVLKTILRFFMKQLWRGLIHIFDINKKDETSTLSNPISIRVPLHLLEEIEAQAAITGVARSTHIANLIGLGSKYYRASTDYISSLNYNHFSLVTRLHYVFNVLDLDAGRVSEYLGFDNSSVVSTWLDGTVHPSFENLEQFSEKFCLNPEWLKFGNKDDKPEFTPFIVEYHSFHSFFDGLKAIFEGNRYPIKNIKLIRSEEGSLIISVIFQTEFFDSPRGEYLVKNICFDNLKLKTIHDVGANGFNNLIELAILCKILHDQIQQIYTFSYDISAENFEEIKQGMKLPIHFDLWGQKNDIWCESIFTKSDLSRYDDRSYWSGAIELFASLQNSKLFQAQLKSLEDEETQKCIYEIVGLSYIHAYKFDLIK